MIDIKIDTSELERLGAEGPKRIREGIKEAVRWSTLAIWKEARTGFAKVQGGNRRLKGGVRARARATPALPPPGPLRQVTRNLLRNINFKIGSQGTVTTGEVGANLVYARIHEIGGMAGRGRRSRIPPRPYLGPAMERRRADVLERFNREVTGGV